MTGTSASRVVAILKVTDVSRTLAWYEAAGFDVRAQHPVDRPTWGEVARDGTAIQFLSGRRPGRARRR